MLIGIKVLSLIALWAIMAVEADPNRKMTAIGRLAMATFIMALGILFSLEEVPERGIGLKISPSGEIVGKPLKPGVYLDIPFVGDTVFWVPKSCAPRTEKFLVTLQMRGEEGAVGLVRKYGYDLDRVRSIIMDLARNAPDSKSLQRGLNREFGKYIEVKEVKGR